MASISFEVKSRIVPDKKLIIIVRLEPKQPYDETQSSGEQAMPLYFFDFRDGDSVINDDEGIELSSFKVARDDAMDFVIATAKDACQVIENRVFTVTVRDEGGAALFRATLTVGVEFLDPQA